jgi:hypothetical protein
MQQVLLGFLLLGRAAQASVVDVVVALGRRQGLDGVVEVRDRDRQRAEVGHQLAPLLRDVVSQQDRPALVHLHARLIVIIIALVRVPLIFVLSLLCACAVSCCVCACVCVCGELIGGPTPLFPRGEKEHINPGG